MIIKHTWYLIFFTCFVYSQQSDSITQYSHYITPEFLLGKTLESNSGFPETKLQKGLFMNFERYHNQKIDD